MGLIILQWNARSLIANGQEYKKYESELQDKHNMHTRDLVETTVGFYDSGFYSN